MQPNLSDRKHANGQGIGKGTSEHGSRPNFCLKPFQKLDLEIFLKDHDILKFKMESLYNIF